MDWITEAERKIPIAADVDVLVCGGGAACNVVRVLLV